MVILSAYYAASLRNDESQIIEYYTDVCNKSSVSKTGSCLVCIARTQSDPNPALQLPGQLRRPRHVLIYNRGDNAQKQ